MKKLIIITALPLLFACHRHTAPQVTTVTKDSVVYKQVLKDTTIVIPGATITLTDTLPCPQLGYDTVSKSGNVTMSLKISKGHITAVCKADSLMNVITWLENSLEMYHAQLNTITIEKPVPKPYIPKWVWYSVIGNVALLGWTFKSPLTGIVKRFI